MMRKALAALAVGIAAGTALLGGASVTTVAGQWNEPNQDVVVQWNEPNQSGQ
ncbi:hypothetical protein [Kitasatospora sp. NPDC001132]